MLDNASTSWRDRTAIAGSIAFHLLVLLVLVSLGPRVSPSSEEADDRAVLGSIVRIERRPPTPAPTPRPRLVVPVAAAAPTPPPVLVATTTAHARRPLVAIREHRYVPPRPTPAPTAPARYVATAPPRAAPVAVAVATPATSPPLPAASATPAQIAEQEMGIGNLGETWPARPMPGMLDALRAKIPAHAVVRIELDEHGRPLSITIVSIDDPAQRDALKADLAAASYIPARCNGLDCAETLTLRI